MVKTVNEVASGLIKDKKDLVREKQRVRDEIKRQKIKTQKVKNRFVVSDEDAEKIADVLRNKVSSNKDDELAALKNKCALLQRENIKLTKENQRLNLKIEKYADDFKELSMKQLQESAEKSSELQKTVEEMNNASLWQRITGHFD